MTSPVLFSTGASQASSTSRNLVEFKAGKMEMRDKMVHPIKRQGLVYLRQSPDDNLMHFCWKDRQTGVTEDDLILFPDDCEFKRVRECTTGRVYVLKMKSSNRKMFFWMQEAKTDRDEEFCKKINEMLNNPPRAGSEMSSSSDRDLQSLFGNMTQEQVAQILSSNGVNLASLLNSAAGRSPSTNSGASASSTASTTNSAPNSANNATSINTNVPITGARESSPSLNDLRALISGALMEGNEDEANALMAATMTAQAEAAAGGSSNQNRDSQQQPLIDLSTAINSESLAHLLNDGEFLRQIEPHLPPVTQISSSSSPSSEQQPLSVEERKKQLAETIRSSQFRSSLSQFCLALQSGQLGPLMSQFGLNHACVEAANLGNLEAFVRALDAQTKSSSSTSNDNNSAGGTSSSGGQQPPPSDSKDKN